MVVVFQVRVSVLYYLDLVNVTFTGMKTILNEGSTGKIHQAVHKECCISFWDQMTMTSQQTNKCLAK